MDWIGHILILLLFILGIMFLLKKGSSWNSSCPNLPPGPRTVPIFGNLLMMDLKRPHKTMIELSKEYGPIFRLKMGFEEMVVLTGYETVKEALVNQADAFAERASVPFFEDFTKGFGIIFSHGENWKVMRRFALSTLRDYGMGKRTIEDKITEECSVLMKTIETYAGKPIDITTIMGAAVSNIIVSILFGKRYDYEDATFLRLLKLFSENIQLSRTLDILIFNMFPKLALLLGSRKKRLNNRKELHTFLQDAFIEHLNDLDENDQRSFIDSFLVRHREEKKRTTEGYFHFENFRSVVSNLFAAGTETTSNTLRWAILLMMKFPEIQKKVQEEIAKEIGIRQPRTEDRLKMPYTDAVIHEVQRFADIVPSNLPHATTMDITFKGFFIPKGTHIIPLLTSVLRDESQWEKPHEFYPEHFLDSEGKFVKRDAFMPFSAGRRACAGEKLAKMELFLFFTSLLQKFTFQPPPGTSKDDLDLTPVVGLTSIPKPYKTCAVLR
ncbi:PREDICTED: cytochrome P450 2K1-like isoform X2 [Thamnophis sirtalis]|uniref:Cytochrome P450 2K1-like isoform X2 n=1 Tax=Thamnophis sirtalis TaxID=35019 RepID=A0A6I9X2F8_9SAUR|nr:PREDICTED: cytochrome P450 2K1-like isoform X2 [Thamnophis sirtalis]